MPLWRQLPNSHLQVNYVPHREATPVRSERFFSFAVIGMEVIKKANSKAEADVSVRIINAPLQANVDILISR